ncbi:MAG TPA: ATP synthase F1 subunit gamma [Thermomicrobiales bacterium]|nr:ATP synthase F1 subunit gamma [Thermomicrobiales bacterium]
MPSPREIRRRVRSVKNMSQITRALEMVAASKMRRAQERVTRSRPYSERLREVLGDLASMPMDAEQLRAFPLLAERSEIKKTALILVTPDRGLSGALTANILRRATQYIRRDAGAPVEVIAVGKKGIQFSARTRQNVVAQFQGLGDAPSLDDIRPITQVAIDEFLSGNVDAVHLVFPQFVNTLVQRAEVVQILPIVRPEKSNTTEDYIFEPDAGAVLNGILPRYVEVLVYQAILDNVASFYSAQMVAMRNATDNAKELVADLDLALNKARQAQITNEVAEIAAGANAFRVE